MMKKYKKRNEFARELEDPKYRQRIEKNKKKHIIEEYRKFEVDLELEHAIEEMESD